MNVYRLCLPATAVLLFACASAGSRTNLRPQPVFVLDGALHSCENLPGATPGTCRAAELVPASELLRSYVVSGDSATVFYGSKAAAGVVVLVTRSLDLSSSGSRIDPMLQIVDGERYRCPPAGVRSFVENPYVCAPAVPRYLPEQVAWIRIVRTPRSIELFGRNAVGGAIVVALKPGSREFPPGTSGILRAAVHHVHSLQSTRPQLSVDPRVLVADSLRSSSSEKIHPYPLLAEILTPYTAIVVSSEKARSCDNFVAAACTQSGVAAFVAFSTPRVRGDSATFEASLRYWRPPTLQGLARNAVDVTARDRRENSPVTTRYRLELVRRDGIWSVIGSSILTPT